MLFTVEGYAFSNLNNCAAIVLNSFLDSIVGQYALNLYTGQHKQTGNVNLLPMPDYATRQSDIERIVNAIIEIKRKWFSLDETNLEYHGLIAQMHIDTTIDAALNKMQEQLTADYTRYEELVKENDDLWMDLADIDRNSEFRQTLNNYKSRRPYEELLSIDGASCQNVIDKKVLAQEIVMELVGMTFGRWNTAYVKGEQAIPEFGDVFDALPFMPVVSQGEAACPAQLDVPTDGILTNNSDSSLCLASHVREVMHYLWADRADDMEYELCQLIGCKSLQAYLASPTGFFDYHFKRYTKSRRKAPIYWLLASEDGTVDYWVYYPKLSKNTLPQLIIRLREQQEQLRTRLNAALAAHDKTQESQTRAEQEQVEGMMDELNRILAAGYVPNHDDGVPVTAAPLLHLAALNLYTGQHKQTGNVNLLPMPDYATRQSDIERIVNAIIEIKRKWFSLDETNLEYHGLIAQMHIDTTIDAALNKMQEQLTADYTRYEELVKENDDLWMDLADIDRNSEFRQTLNNYKSRRPYEELLSIDGASCQNVIDKKVLAQEIVMELVGMTFGRWNTAYVKGEQAIPEFGDVFDALPFMPVVSQGEAACPAQLDVPTDGILTNNSDSSLCLASHVREVMHYLWADRADDMEYELCQLIGCKSLQAYLASPTGFFDYHFKRYTKSRRKAPIYWLLASEDGTVDYWVYYPKLSKNTLPQLIIRLREQQEQLRTRLNAALAAHDKTQESQTRAEQEQVEGMMDELNRILAAGYVPNHDDGVPVTAAPLLHLAASRPWRVECEKNMELLEKGDYDWSHLAMSMYPARVTQKAKKDWCMALTHGLEHICENKPKEKKARKKKGDNINPQLSLSF